jgi:hypothetical protein
MSEVTRLEQQLSDAKTLIARKDMALKLAENFEFRTLIIDGFCRDEAARLAGQTQDPVLTERQQRDAANMAAAPGHLRRYLSMIVQQAAVAERDVVDLEETIAEARLDEDREDA